MYGITKGWFRGPKIGIKVLKGFGSEPNYQRDLNKKESKNELDTNTKGFTVHGGLYEHVPSYKVVIFHDKIGQGFLHDHYQSSWYLLRALMVPVVAPLGETVATEARASSHKPFHDLWWGSWAVKGFVEGHLALNISRSQDKQENSQGSLHGS